MSLRKLALVLLSLLLPAAVATAWWVQRERTRVADSVCESTLEMSAHASQLSTWVSEAAADPFLGQSALLGPPNGLLAEVRARARVAVTRARPDQFSPSLREALQQLATAPAHGAALAEALRAVSSAATSLRCDVRNPASPTTPPGAGVLAAQVAAGARFWEERKASAVQDRQQFERDRVIFCRAESLLQGLHRVVSAAGEACRSAKAGSRLAKGCEAGGERTGGVAAEIEDLEKQREFNLRKLRQKWPEAVLGGLRC